MTADEKRSELVEDKQEHSEFDRVKVRLEEIANAVEDEGLSLDAALDLYEEAVSLGLQASDLLEVGIVPEDERPLGKDDAELQADGEV